MMDPSWYVHQKYIYRRGSTQNLSIHLDQYNLQNEVISVFALTLAPFLGVLVGGGLIQLVFGWDAAPVRLLRGVGADRHL